MLRFGGPPGKPEPGLVHIYTGDGKGKTTAALGLALRASGRGFRVLVVQFLKGAFTGELAAAEKLGPGFRFRRGPDTAKFTWQMDEAEKAACRQVQEELLAFAEAEARAGSCDLLVLDEVLGALGAGMLGPDRVEAFLRTRPEALEVVLTGRDAPAPLVELADYVSEIRAVKHPWTRGLAARPGIES